MPKSWEEVKRERQSKLNNNSNASSWEDIKKSRGWEPTPAPVQTKTTNQRIPTYDSLDTFNIQKQIMNYQATPSIPQVGAESIKPTMPKIDTPQEDKQIINPLLNNPALKGSMSILKPFEYRNYQDIENPTTLQKALMLPLKARDKLSTFVYGASKPLGGDIATRFILDREEKKLLDEAESTRDSTKLQQHMDSKNYWTDDKRFNFFLGRKLNSDISTGDRATQTAGEIAGEITKFMLLSKLTGGISTTKNGVLNKIIQRGATGATSGALSSYGEGGETKDIIKESLKSAGFMVAGGVASDKVGNVLVDKLTPIYHKYPQFSKALQTIVATGKGATMGTVGATTETALSALFGEEIKPKDIIKTGLTLAAYEGIMSILTQQPFRPSFELNGNSGIKMSNEDTSEWLRKNGYSEFQKGSGIWIKRDANTGALLDQRMEIVNLRGVNVYKSDIWKAEKSLGRSLKPSEIVEFVKNPDSFIKTVRGTGTPTQQTPSNSSQINPKQAKSNANELLLLGENKTLTNDSRALGTKTAIKKVNEIKKPEIDKPIDFKQNDVVDYKGSQYKIKGEEGSNFVAVDVETGKQTFIPKMISDELDLKGNRTTELEIDDRDFQNVSSRKIKSYQWENPEVKPYYQNRAKELLRDLNDTVKGERYPIKEHNEIKGYTGTSRFTSDSIARIKDQTGASYDQIKDALQRLIHNKGQENIALAKKIELVIDDDLVNGYTTFDGNNIEPNKNYISVRNKLEKNQVELPKENVDLNPIDGGKEFTNQLTFAIPNEQASIFDTDQQQNIISPQATEKPQTNKNDNSGVISQQEEVKVSETKTESSEMSRNENNNLKGTDKQIKWAKDIVNKEISHLDDILNTVKTNSYKRINGMILTKGKETYTYEDAIVAKTEEKFKKEVETVNKLLSSLINEEDSKFVIENRNNILEAIAQKNKISVRYKRILRAYEEIKKYNNDISKSDKTKSSNTKSEGLSKMDIDSLASQAGGPQLGKSTGATTKSYRKVKRSSQIVKDIQNKLEIAVKKGGVHYTRLGQFNNQNHIIRIAKANDIPTLAHETGHYFDKLFNLSMSYSGNADAKNKITRNKELANLGENTSRNSYPNWKKRREGVAEYIRGRLTLGTDHVKNLAPEFHSYFENIVPKELINVIEEIGKDIIELTNLDAVSRVKTQIRFAGDKEGRESFDLLETLRTIYTGLVDSNYPIEWAAKELGGKEFKEQIANELSAFRGYEGIALFDLNPKGDKDFYQTNLQGKKVGKSYFDIVSPIHNSEEMRRDFWAYSVARRSKDYFDKGLELPDTQETYKEVVKELEKQYPEFKQIFDELLEYRRNSLNLLVEAGVYKAEDIAQIEVANPNYVSLKRIKESIDSVTGSSSKVGGSKKVVKKRTGGGEDIIDPEESDITNTFIHRSVALRNKILVQLANIAETVEGKGWIMEPSPIKINVRTFNLEQVKKQLIELFEDRQDIKEQYGDAKQFVDSLDLDVLARIYSPNYLAGPNQTVIYIDGEPVLYDLHPDVAEAINGIDFSQSSKAIQTLMSIANVQKTGIIFTPRFVAYNAARDTFHNLVSSKGGINPIDIISGFMSVITKDKWYRFAQRQGATTNFFTANDRKFAQEVIDDIMTNHYKGTNSLNVSTRILTQSKNIAKHPLRFIQDLIEPGEMGGRTAEFKKILRQYLKSLGYSDKDIRDIDEAMLSNIDIKEAKKAVAGSRNLSVDFRVSGRWIKQLQLNRIINFLNPQIQGTVNVGKMIKERPLQTFIKGLLYITIPTLANMYLNRNNPNYKELPHWRRDFYWNVPIGNPDTTHLFLPIPRPWELGLLFGAIPERMAEKLLNDDVKAFDEFNQSIKDTLLPDLMPTAVGPILELYANKDWKGDPIISQGDERVSPELQYNEYTNKVLVKIADALKDVEGLPETFKSPKKLQHLIEGYTGTWGRTILSGSMQSVTVDAFYSSQSITNFYKYKDELDTKYADSLREDTKLKPIDKAMKDQYQEANELLTLFRTTIKAVETADLTKKEKENKQQNIRVAMIELTRKLNEVYEKTYRK